MSRTLFVRVFVVAVLFVAVANAFTASPLKSSRVLGACSAPQVASPLPTCAPAASAPAKADWSLIPAACHWLGGRLFQSLSVAICSPRVDIARARRANAVLTCASLTSAPRAGRSVTASAQPQMSFEAASSQIATVTNALLAVKETDFGGYTGPAVALVVLGILISVLTNPVRGARPRALSAQAPCAGPAGASWRRHDVAGPPDARDRREQHGVHAPFSDLPAHAPTSRDPSARHRPRSMTTSSSKQIMCRADRWARLHLRSVRVRWPGARSRRSDEMRMLLTATTLRLTEPAVRAHLCPVASRGTVDARKAGRTRQDT
jgi:hypothetical protein